MNPRLGLGAQLPSGPPAAAVVGTALPVAVGAAVTVNWQLAFIGVLAVLGVMASSASASSWVAAALVAALTFRGFVELGVLPAVATFVDLPLAWGALAVALRRRHHDRARAPSHLRWLAALAVAVAMSWLFHPTEVLRPILYLALLGQPFAIIGALCLDPPSPRARRMLKQLLLLLLVIQIPVAAFQLVAIGPFDAIQGTLYGAGAGAHVISAVAVVGAIWLFLTGDRSPLKNPWRLAVIAALALMPFVADARQVILALPAILLVSRWGEGVLRLLVRGLLVAAAIVALFTLQPFGNPAVDLLERAAAGGGGKTQTASFVWDRLSAEPASVVFGLGPAETVSRAAFMTTDLLLRTDSPIRVLDLKPAELAVEAQLSLGASGIGTSFNAGVLSALGVLGDIGLAGLAVYVGMLVAVVVALRRLRSPEAAAAASGFAMFAVLGLVFDWWEQPPFSIVLAVLAGLALTAEPRDEARGSGEPAWFGRVERP